MNHSVIFNMLTLNKTAPPQHNFQLCARESIAAMLPIAVSLTRLQFFMSNGDGLNPITTADNTVGPPLVDCYQILIARSTYCEAAKRPAF